MAGSGARRRDRRAGAGGRASAAKWVSTLWARPPRKHSWTSGARSRARARTDIVFTGRCV